MGIENLKDLDAATVAKTPQKPGRKPKDIGKSTRSYSIKDARNIACILDGNLLNGPDGSKFDGNKYMNDIDIAVFSKSSFHSTPPSL